jgi:hypothetical protein
MSVKIDQEVQGDPAQYYLVETTFSNHWNKGRRCQDTPIQDPLLEPQQVQGSFTKAQWVAKYDGYGNKLITSANEPLTGAQVTFDYVRPTVSIKQNVANLGLSTFANMVNTVNQYPLWGCPARTIKLTNAPWERKVQGRCCYFYTRTFEFEIDFYNQDQDGNPIGFDHEVFDGQSMVLLGNWHTNATLPPGDKTGTADPYYGQYMIFASVSDTMPNGLGDYGVLNSLSQNEFKPYKSMDNEKARVYLDGHGRPANAKWNRCDPKTGAILASGTAGPPASEVVQYYRESDFLQLGIPTVF